MTITKTSLRISFFDRANQLRQLYLKEIIKIKDFIKFKNVEQVHFFDYYIGNYPYLEKNKIIQITKILDKIFF
tara:strand:+ start:277 stop:495 length:219 start_codon:yes stop_codon:yes gene_type:complete